MQERQHNTHMLGSWYVYGYEGASREERRRFFSQRDDPCESDHEADEQLSCFQKKRRLRKVRRRRSTSLAPCRDDEDRGEDRLSESDEYDLVETSASSSNHSDGDTWWGADDERPDQGDATHPPPESSKERGLLFDADSTGTEPSRDRLEHHVVRCVPKVDAVPPLTGASAVLLFHADPIVVMLHGGLPNTARLSVSPTNDTFLLTQLHTDGWLSTPLVPGRLAVLHAVAPTLSDTPCSNWDQLPTRPPLSLKRWTSSVRLPHRYGHCAVTLPSTAVPVHGAAMLDEWNSMLWGSTSALHKDKAFDCIDVSMVVTLGGCGDAMAATTAPSRAVPRESGRGMMMGQLSGCMLSEPIIQLCIRLRSQHKLRPAVVWSGSVSLQAEMEDGHMLPRSFFSCTAWSGHRQCHSTQQSSSKASFLVFGGTEDGTSPIDNGMQVMTVDTVERSYALEPLVALGTLPSPRFGHTMTPVRLESAAPTYVLHGGVGHMGVVLGDVHILEGATCVWREIIVPVGDSVIVRPRAFHAAWCCGDQHQKVVVCGGDDGQHLVPSMVAFDAAMHRWSTITCPLLDADALGGEARRCHEAGIKKLRTSAALHAEPASTFLRNDLGDSKRSRADTALRDTLQLANERQFRSASTPSLAHLSRTICAVCNGSAAAVVPTSSCDTSSGVWMFGGSQNFHRSCLSAVHMRPGDKTLKEIVAMWLLEHEGFNWHTDADAASGEHHARRLSASSQLKSSWCVL